jgi:hypothetical protein
VEGGRLLHDLLPGRAAADLAHPGGSRRAGGRVALAVLPPRAVPAAHADHAVRAGQRAHQRLPAGRPHRGDDARRPRQRQRTAAVLHLRGGLQFLGPGLRRRAHGGAAGAAGRRGPGHVPRARPAHALPMCPAA